MMLASIDAGALLKMFYASLLAGVGTATIFALALFGATKASDMRRSERTVAATAYAALAALGFLAVAGVVVYGLILVGRK